MNKAIVLAGLLLAVALSGCTQPVEPIVSYKFVCSDGTIVESVSQCQPGTEPNLDELCQDYCQDIVEPGQEYSKEYIQEQIDEANYCEAEEDCVLATRKCPFGCYVFVNKNELERIDGLIKAYKQTCMLTCAPLEKHTCFESKCRPVVYGEVWDNY